MTPRRRIVMMWISILLFIFAMIVFLRTRPIDVYGVPLPPVPENNAYDDLVRLAKETIARSEKSFTMREGLRLLPFRGDEELRRNFLDEMGEIHSELKALMNRPLVPVKRATYETDDFPGDSTQYWSKLCAAQIHQAILRKDYHKAADDLAFSIRMHQKISEYAEDALRSRTNIGISYSLAAVHRAFDQLPEESLSLFVGGLNDADENLTPSMNTIDAEEWVLIAFYRELQEYGGNKAVTAYIDLRATAARTKSYFDGIRQEMHKPVLERKRPEPIGGPVDLLADPLYDAGVDPGLNDWIRCKIRVTAAAIAVKEHRTRTGTLPESLEGVYKRTDPYTGKPFIYKIASDGFQVYSPAHDGDDDRGRPMPGFASKDGDITVVINSTREDLDQPVILK